MSSSDDSEILDAAGGNPARSAFLKAALKRIRDSSTDVEFQREIDDVLSGKKGLRQAATNETFNRGISSMVTRGLQKYNDLDEEQRESMAQEGADQYSKLDEELRRPTAPSASLRKSRPRRELEREDEDAPFDEISTWLR